MDNVLTQFHMNKKIFLDLSVCNNFNFIFFEITDNYNTKYM